MNNYLITDYSLNLLVIRTITLRNHLSYFLTEIMQKIVLWIS